MKHENLLSKIAAWAFWILAWQTGAVIVNRSLLIPIPTPVDTASALIRLMSDRSFFHAVFLSIARIAAGFALAFAAGTILAVLCVKIDFLHTLFTPVLMLIRAIPVASFTILIFLWVSREKIPSTITFFTVLPVIWANVETGLRAADTGLVEMARVFGLPGSRILREILLPSIRPFFSSAIASGIGFAWKSGVAAEVICRTSNSLGNLLWAGKSSVAYDEVFAVTLVIVGLSMLLQYAAGRLLHIKAKKVPSEKESDNRPSAEPAITDPLAQKALLFDRVTFGYGLKKPVISNISLRIKSGDRICLTGRSGSGKTTFLRLAMGLLKPKSGTVTGTENLSISPVFQEDRLIPWKTVLENVLFFSGSEKDSRTVEAAEALLKEAGLGGSEQLLPEELSGGMKRRAALVRALMHPFDLLVLDEAFTGLDDETKKRCLGIVDAYASGRMILMASHDAGDAAFLGAESLKI